MIACMISKEFGESLAFGLHREEGAESIVVRFFNTTGPRQSGAYGMVVPRLAMCGRHWRAGRAQPHRGAAAAFAAGGVFDRNPWRGRGGGVILGHSGRALSHF